MKNESISEKAFLKKMRGGIIKVPTLGLTEALNVLYRPVVGDKELLPHIEQAEEPAYKNYFLISLDKSMGIQGIESLLNHQGGEYTDILTFLSLQEEKPTLGDKAPCVVFWKKDEQWFHCLCGLRKKEKIRFCEISPVWKKYPVGTSVVVSPLLS